MALVAASPVAPSESQIWRGKWETDYGNRIQPECNSKTRHLGLVIWGVWQPRVNGQDQSGGAEQWTPRWGWGCFKLTPSLWTTVGVSTVVRFQLPALWEVPFQEKRGGPGKPGKQDSTQEFTSPNLSRGAVGQRQGRRWVLPAEVPLYPDWPVSRILKNWVLWLSPSVSGMVGKSWPRKAVPFVLLSPFFQKLPSKPPASSPQPKVPLCHGGEGVCILGALSLGPAQKTLNRPTGWKQRKKTFSSRKLCLG